MRIIEEIEGALGEFKAWMELRCDTWLRARLEDEYDDTVTSGKHEGSYSRRRRSNQLLIRYYSNAFKKYKAAVLASRRITLGAVVSCLILLGRLLTLYKRF